MKNNKVLKNLLIFIMIFIILFVLSRFKPSSNDDYYSFGFSYNIAKGLIPYKDYNMIVGPFYSLLLSSFLMIFGNHMIVYEIIHIIFYSSILTVIYNKIGNKILYLILVTLAFENSFVYNNYCLYSILGILLLLDSKYKYKTELIGLIIGSIIMTKHNIGGALFLIYFFTGKGKIKRGICASIPVLLMFTYLLINNLVFEYLDFCIFGMGSFISNLYVSPICLLLLIAIIIYLVRIYRENKDVKILYILASFIYMFPLFVYNHIDIVVVLFTYYVLLINKKDYFVFFIKTFIVFTIIINYVVLFIYGVRFVKDNNPFAYKLMKKQDYEIVEYINKFKTDHKGKYYYLGYFAYFTRMYNNETLRFSDLINKGNLGKNEDKYVDDMIEDCKDEKCYFVFSFDVLNDKNTLNQTIKGFSDAVLDNYYLVDKSNYVGIFENDYTDEK